MGIKRYNGEEWVSSNPLAQVSSDDILNNSQVSGTKITQVINNLNTEKISNPSGGTIGNVLVKIENGVKWDALTADIAEYLKSVSINNDNITFIKKDGTEQVFNSFQNKSNLVTSIDEESSDSQYPSAKCIYDLVGNLENLLEGLL